MKQNGLPSLKTSHYSKPKSIHPVMETGKGKFGIPSNFMYFSNIDKISVLGNESCVCYKAYDMKISIKSAHMKLNESCNFHSKLAKNPDANLLANANVLIFDRKPTKKIDQDKRNPSTHADLHKHFLDDRQNLFRNYIKAVQELYKTYLRDAHNKIHEQGYNYVHFLGNGD